jgi:hypothetical protein
MNVDWPAHNQRAVMDQPTSFVRTFSRGSLATVLLVATTFAACSSAPEASSGSPGGPLDAAIEGSSGDAFTPGSGETASHDASHDASTDARLDTSPMDGGPDLTSHPPPGATKCGGGTFSAAAAAACQAASMVLAPPVPPRSCNLLDMAGGAFEVWCSASGVYLFARFDAVKVLTPYACQRMVGGQAASYYPPMRVEMPRFEVHAGASASGGNGVRNGGAFLASSPTTFTVEASSSFAAPAGTANLWIPTQQQACVGEPDLPQVFATGVAFVWP